MAEFRLFRPRCAKCGKFVDAIITSSDINVVAKTKTVTIKCSDCHSIIDKIENFKL